MTKEIKRKTIRDTIFDFRIVLQVCGDVKTFQRHLETSEKLNVPDNMVENSEGLFVDYGGMFAIWVSKPNADLIAHEVAHAVNYVSTTLRIPTSDNNEFQSCYAAFLTGQIYSLAGLKWKY